jgi:hypothetical protein
MASSSFCIVNYMASSWCMLVSKKESKLYQLMDLQTCSGFA